MGKKLLRTLLWQANLYITEVAVLLFFKADVLKNLGRFTWKHLCWSPAKETPTQEFSCESSQIFKNRFFIEHLWWLILLWVWDLTLSWRKSLSYRNQYIDLQGKSMDWVLYNRDLHHEKVNLTPFKPIIIFYLAWKYPKTKGSMMFSGV